jgi:Ino eighty subunit 2
MPPARRSTRAAPTSAARESAKPYTRTNTRRSGSPSAHSPAASVSRTPPGGNNSLKLTVKAAPSKLRQAISGSQLPPNPYTDEASESDATPKPSSRTARATRNPRTVVEQDSDEDEDDDEDAEGLTDDEDADGEEVDQELLANEDSQDDAEGEDEDMDDTPARHPPPPIIKHQKASGKSNDTIVVAAPPAGPLKSVEAKELEDADDDELSELESGDEMELGEGEEEEEAGEEDDDLSGSDIDGSRSATPDITKLTRRQRGVLEEEENAGLLALSNEAQKKKMLSVEEHAMRRQEMARRRKNLSEKRNEEEKVCCHYVLLFKKQYADSPTRWRRSTNCLASKPLKGAQGQRSSPPSKLLT